MNLRIAWAASQFRGQHEIHSEILQKNKEIFYSHYLIYRILKIKTLKPQHQTKKRDHLPEQTILKLTNANG